MKFKPGDKVKVRDRSYNFGIDCGEYSTSIGHGNLTVVATGLTAMRGGHRLFGEYTQVCDLLVTDGNGGFWFTQTRFCEAVDKKIEIRYFCDDEDVTDQISDETKRNLQ